MILDANEEKYDKIKKILGAEIIAEFDNMPTDMLEGHIISAEHNINDAQRELEANPKYQDLKESLKAISEGLKEVKKRQNAVIQYSLHLLEERRVK